MSEDARRVAFLGPLGTFGEEAALRLAPHATRLPFPSHAAVAAAVERGDADAGVLAIENSMTGSVGETLDILVHENTSLRIQAEVVVPIVHNLVAAPGTKVEDVTVVFTHPAAFGQCSKFLAARLPGVRMEAALSTTDAVQTAIRRGSEAAAIGSRRAADLHGGEILAAGIHDSDTNATRFLLVGAGTTHSTGRDRTSIAFAFAQDYAGALSTALDVFGKRRINCSKLESRPTRAVFGEYIFLLDFHGHVDDPEIAEALAELRTICSEVTIFGSYPRWSPDAASA